MSMTYKTFITKAQTLEGCAELSKTARFSSHFTFDSNIVDIIQGLAKGYEAELRICEWLTQNDIPFGIDPSLVYEQGETWPNGDHPDITATPWDVFHGGSLLPEQEFEVKFHGRPLHEENELLCEQDGQLAQFKNTHRARYIFVCSYNEDAWLIRANTREILRRIKIQPSVFAQPAKKK